MSLFQSSQNFQMSDTQQSLSSATGQTTHHTPSLSTQSELFLLPQTTNSSITNPQLVQMMNNTLNSSTTAEYMKWSDSEVSMLVQWLKKPENMDLFFNKKKVTAIKKIRELLPQKTERQIKNKLASLENTYKKAKQKLLSNWGFATPDTDTYNMTEEKIKRACPFYDDLDIIFTNGVQSPQVNVDLTHSDTENINISENNSYSAANTNELAQNKQDPKKGTNTLNQLGIDNNLSSLLQIIDSRILQRNDVGFSKGSITEQKLLLKEKLYEKKLQRKDRQFSRKEKMFEAKMHLKEKELELVNKELDIRRFEAEIRMEEIKLKRQIQESMKEANKTIVNTEEIGKRRKFN